MFIIAKLVFQSYIPDEIVPGMMFKQHIRDFIVGDMYEYDHIFMLQTKIFDQDAYIATNGYPVKPYIYTMTANPDAKADVLATPDQIGWFDEGEHSDELRDVELKDFNNILQNEESYIEIEVDEFINEDGEEIVVPTLYMDKVTIRIVTDEPEYEEEDDYEDWDDMDDLTDEDPE